MPEPTPLPRPRLFVGADIAAKTVTAAWGEHAHLVGRPQTFDQDAAGHAALIQAVNAQGVPPSETQVLMEATGVYWVGLAVSLHAAGYRVSIVNPAQARDYAHGLGQRSKTDALDARVLWDMASKRTWPAWSPPPQVYHELRQRLVTRDGLQSMQLQAANQLHALRQWPVVIESVQTHLEVVLADLAAHVAALEVEIATLLKSEAWAASAACLLSIPGIGVLTSAWLLVGTLNFTVCATPEAAVNYVGLAPHGHESGTSVWKKPRLGHAGHGRLRTALYLATLSAARHNPLIAPFYQRLRQAGKPHKVARCAAARKLLHIAWAVVTKQQRFDPQRAPTAAREAATT